MYIYIYTESPNDLYFEGQPSKTRPFANQNKGHLGSRYNLYDYVYKSYITSWWFQPPLKNISQIGNLPQIGENIKNIWNHKTWTAWTFHPFWLG